MAAPPSYDQSASIPQGAPLRYGNGHTIAAPLGMGQRAPFLTSAINRRKDTLKAETEVVSFNHSQFVPTAVMSANPSTITSGDVITLWNGKQVLGCVMEKAGIFSKTMVPKIKWYPENSVAEHCRFAIFARAVFQQAMSDGELGNMMSSYRANQCVPGPALSLGQPVVLVPLTAPHTLLHPTLFNPQKPNPDEKGVVVCDSPSVEPHFEGFRFHSIVNAPSTASYLPGTSNAYVTLVNAQDTQTAANAQVTQAAVNATMAVGQAGFAALSNGFNTLTRSRPATKTTTTTTYVVNNRR